MKLTRARGLATDRSLILGTPQKKKEENLAWRTGHCLSCPRAELVITRLVRTGNNVFDGDQLRPQLLRFCGLLARRVASPDNGQLTYIHGLAVGHWIDNDGTSSRHILCVEPARTYSSSKTQANRVSRLGEIEVETGSGGRSRCLWSSSSGVRQRRWPVAWLEARRAAGRRRAVLELLMPHIVDHTRRVPVTRARRRRPGWPIFLRLSAEAHAPERAALELCHIRSRIFFYNSVT
jgi:hypothetical protein